MDSLDIVYVSMDEITPYENNPRMNDGAVESVAKSISEFGFKVPIVLGANRAGQRLCHCLWTHQI